MRQLLIIICSLFLLCGCTVPVNFYIRNTTNDMVLMKAHLMNENISNYDLLYNKEKLALSYNLHKSLSMRLKPIRIEGGYLYFELLPKSTFFVGHGSNFKNFTFDEIILVGIDQREVTLNWGTHKLFEKGKSFPNKHYAWYDIE